MESAACPPCPVSLADEQVERFRRDGYLAFSDILNADELATARESISDIVRRIVAGGVQSRVAPDGLVQPLESDPALLQFEAGTTVDPESSPEDLELKMRKLMFYCNKSPFFHELSHSQSRIHGVLESLIGPDSILFQDMALVKPPFIGSEKPWHQDDAYFSVAPLDAVVGVWIALDDATVENGCMHVIPGGQAVGPRRHYHGRDCEIVPDRLQGEDVRPVELPAGGGMFFVGLLPHRTPPNTSSRRRRALQFHYRAASSQKLERDEYDRVFAEADGSPASCAAATERA